MPLAILCYFGGWDFCLLFASVVYGLKRGDPFPIGGAVLHARGTKACVGQAFCPSHLAPARRPLPVLVSRMSFWRFLHTHKPMFLHFFSCRFKGSILDMLVFICFFHFGVRLGDGPVASVWRVLPTASLKRAAWCFNICLYSVFPTIKLIAICRALLFFSNNNVDVTVGKDESMM